MLLELSVIQIVDLHMHTQGNTLIEAPICIIFDARKKGKYRWNVQTLTYLERKQRQNKINVFRDCYRFLYSQYAICTHNTRTQNTCNHNTSTHNTHTPTTHALTTHAITTHNTMTPQTGDRDRAVKSTGCPTVEHSLQLVTVRGRQHWTSNTHYSCGLLLTLCPATHLD